MSAKSMRLVQSADFERLLAMPSLSRSFHFALHHLAAQPLPAPKPMSKALSKAGAEAIIPSFLTELSTGLVSDTDHLVDNLPTKHWLGYVVPKRHAKRAVTRSLLKRQIRSVFDEHAAALPCGQWVVRLRSPFAPAQFVSARSLALKQAARTELVSLLSRVRVPGTVVQRGQ